MSSNDITILPLTTYTKPDLRHSNRVKKEQSQFIASTLVFLVNDMWQMKSTSQKYESGE